MLILIAFAALVVWAAWCLYTRRDIMPVVYASTGVGCLVFLGAAFGLL